MQGQTAEGRDEDGPEPEARRGERDERRLPTVQHPVRQVAGQRRTDEQRQRRRRRVEGRALGGQAIHVAEARHDPERQVGEGRVEAEEREKRRPRVAVLQHRDAAREDRGEAGRGRCVRRRRVGAVTDDGEAEGGGRQGDRAYHGERAAPAGDADERGQWRRGDQGADEPDRRGDCREEPEPRLREPGRRDLERADERHRGPETDREPSGEERTRCLGHAHHQRPEPHDGASSRDDTTDTERVDEQPRGDHQRGVRVEVGRREQPDEHARHLELLHQIPRDDAGRGAMKERDEEEQRGHRPHRPCAREELHKA